MNIPVERLHLLALNAGCCYHNGDWNWTNVRSPFLRLYYVTESTAEVELPSGRFRLTPHHLYMIPAYTVHNCFCNSHFVHYYIHIFEDIQNEPAILEDLEMPVEVEAQPGDLELIKRLCDINPELKIPASNPNTYDNHQTLVDNYLKNQQSAFHKKVESHGIMIILLSRFLRLASAKSEVKDNRIQQTLTYIRKNIGQTIDFDHLASMACMSKGHFFRTFREHTGETPNQFVTKRKLELAELALVTTNKPIKNIATSLGYEDYSYFIRAFRKNVGVTPQQYRENHFK